MTIDKQLESQSVDVRSKFDSLSIVTLYCAALEPCQVQKNQPSYEEYVKIVLSGSTGLTKDALLQRVVVEFFYKFARIGIGV